jgi:predicted O-methyltransferase YrrM
MTDELWTAVDDHVTDLFALQDACLDRALQRCRDAGLPEIQVSATQGAFLGLLVRALRAGRVLEIGTLGGFSTIFMARSLPPGGRVVTLELDPKHVEVARANLVDAGVADRVDVLQGPALESLERLRDERRHAFDFVFIDADKPAYPDYLRAVLPLCREGALIVADNVVRKGAVVDPDPDDANAAGVCRFNAAVAADPRLEGTVIQTVGSKGHDGLAFAVVTRLD